MKLFKIVLAGLFCSTPLLVNAMSPASEVAAPPEQNIERVEVKARKPVTYYRNEYRQQQKNFAKAFNHVVDDSDMKVYCRLESRTGSRLKRQICEPAFVSNIIWHETQFDRAIGNLVDIATVVNRTHVKNKLKTKFKHLKRTIAKLTSENQSLADQYGKLMDTLDKYENYDAYASNN